jgi:opacity protein-like surface antigen
MASAQKRAELENPSWYVGLDYWNNDDTDVQAYGIGLGYDFNNFLGAEVDYYRSETIDSVYEWGAEGFLRGNVRVDPFVFFLRAGAGYIKAVGLPSGFDDNSIVGVWGLGLEFYLSKNLAISVSKHGVYYNADREDLVPKEDALDFKLNITRVGLVYHFNWPGFSKRY